MAEKVQDHRLGQIGGIDTKVCAITGKEASNGMQRISLGDGWYFRVVPVRMRYEEGYVDAELIKKMRSLIPAQEKSVKKDEAKL